MQFPFPDRRLCGLAVPVSALRTKKSCGIGEFSDLIPLADFCKKSGISVIQLLPVNDTGTDSSPYNALSAFALNPVYLCLEELPCAQAVQKHIDKAKKLLKPQTAAERFDYEKVMHEKMQLLREVFESDKEAIIADFKGGELAAWIEKNPWIIEYAVFKRNKRQYLHASWKQWKTMQFPSESGIKKAWRNPALQHDHIFYAWIQMHLHKQLLAAVTYCSGKGVAVKGDIPILLNEDSVEVWAHPELFRTDLRAGSPPDADNPSGQNWGFPIYNWNNLKTTRYRWWKDRLKHADQYYHAYRLDHILGFFRIWAIPEGETTGLLGKTIPYDEITSEHLQEAGFSNERIRWMAEPHVTTQSVTPFVRNDYLYAHGLLHRLMDRIGDEELWLFKSEVKTETDIGRYELPQHVEAFLKQKWHDRMLVSAGRGLTGTAIYTAACRYTDTTAWHSLAEHEKQQFVKLLEEKEASQNILWKQQADDILSELCASVAMQPCAEDLGAIPPVLPEVLQRLGMYSLRVFRWERKWAEQGMPFIPLADYPEAAVAVTAVHDSSSFRQWWNEELDLAGMHSFFKALSIDESTYRQWLTAEGQKPPYTEELALALLKALVQVPSRLAIFPIQDWLSLVHGSFPEIPAQAERINVPGTVQPANWTYRLPLTIEEMLKHKELIKRIKAVVAERNK